MFKYKFRLLTISLLIRDLVTVTRHLFIIKLYTYVKDVYV